MTLTSMVIKNTAKNGGIYIAKIVRQDGVVLESIHCDRPIDGMAWAGRGIQEMVDECNAT